jgi:hypothetical protein
MPPCVKPFLRTLRHALGEERHFALLEKCAESNQKPAFNQLQAGTQSDPCISSIQRSIMIASSNSPAKGSRLPKQYLGVLLHTNACSGLARVRTESLPLLVIPLLPPHPVQTNRQSACHGHLGDLPSSSHGQMEELAPPLRFAPYCRLRRFYHEETQQAAALLADMS